MGGIIRVRVQRAGETVAPNLLAIDGMAYAATLPIGNVHQMRVIAILKYGQFG
jgi:hypothetical protein